MKHKKVLFVSGLILVINLLIACNSSQRSQQTPTTIQSTELTEDLSPKAANAATAIAESGETLWSMVLLGDSLVTVESSSLARQYVDLVQEDLGIEIEITDIGADGLNCKSFLPSLKKYSFNRDPLQEADIILISLGGGDLLLAGENYFKGECDGTEESYCLGEALTEFQSCWDEFLQELTSLADPSNTLIRLIIPGTFFEQYEEQEKFGAYVEFQDKFYTYQIQSSESYGITILDLYHFDESEGFRMGDNIHVSHEGKAIIADMLRKLGYEYKQP
jgi:lysophospholipase L1-like esterase